MYLKKTNTRVPLLTLIESKRYHIKKKKCPVLAVLNLCNF